MESLSMWAEGLRVNAESLGMWAEGVHGCEGGGVGGKEGKDGGTD